jgi:hypothetical protein
MNAVAVSLDRVSWPEGTEEKHVKNLTQRVGFLAVIPTDRVVNNVSMIIAWASLFSINSG